ncbi:trifunctional hydroxymethylpyrimidine kinase/phosphomethylpyrimidine kinase/thiaminase [Yamadazyma tenuis]|uniref:Phosphomethylpyrimidine kinase n=1 Tax=Candida tenuis (strain ATCC 10573 / BCRC 21748 / CBS 615 / JCM 9827 / NBRC 10315 / NRRL Y-1498 / VKM Y-70) TaxID=590646 RepID=G3BFP6_CANTC|nr:uncharacterized protein CANTEDRAFT_111183 [Yamadazyma tenuis ATCC 10573]EGV60071.1 hypothetical protein CANTEDRAFT_111183 [Yamadazyma tenuis ATCC 10573]WEJ94695.1 trifunctional hydroxymethylpyrimidine kinase/phosphomethylpyrimidine kinase/thiaminase [Yamadazyma tenuis]
MVPNVEVKLRSIVPEVSHQLPVVLTIAGSDSSGGAGIEADIKTLSAFKVYGSTCITALTAQNTRGVRTVTKTPKDTLRDILDAIFEDFLTDSHSPLKAIKTGMLTLEAVEVLDEYIDKIHKHDLKVVLDPVMISTSGSQLFDEEGIKLCLGSIIKSSQLVTPNFEEALVLYRLSSGKRVVGSELCTMDLLVDFTAKLQATLGCENVLLKGGHLPWNSHTGTPFREGEDISNKVIRDVLYESKTGKTTVFESVSVESENTHGTGCTLSSAIAANIALGVNLANAVAISIDYIHRGLVNMPVKLGLGNGPLNHTISPARQVEMVVAHSSEANAGNEVVKNNTSVYEFFKTHPKVTPSWQKYTRHGFVEKVASNNLKFNQFLYFLKQDYYYLINYAQIHALAAAVAPSYYQTHEEALIIGEVVEEIEKHRKKLTKKYDIDYERDINIDVELSPGRACLEYCEYLLDIAKREDFLGIKVALAPCLHGYYEAGIYGAELRKNHDGALNALSLQEHSDIYESWLGDYTSDWYQQAHEKGIQALQDLFEKSEITQARLDELVDVFAHVTRLEVRFWDECRELSE